MTVFGFCLALWLGSIVVSVIGIPLSYVLDWLRGQKEC